MTDVLVLSGIAGAVLVLFTFIGVTWKLLRFIFRVDKALPVILAIASQFENNGGSSLKDTIDKIEGHTATLSSENRIAVKIAEDARTVANTNAAIVNELSRVQGEELTHIREYLHTRMHDVMNSLNRTNLQATLTDKRTESIENRLDKLLPLVVRHRATDRPDNESESAQ